MAYDGITIEEIRAWQGTNLFAQPPCPGGVYINWLIAEVERLNSERDRYKAEVETAYRSGLLKAAEIAENTGLDGTTVLWGREAIRKAITEFATSV